MSKRIVKSIIVETARRFWRRAGGNRSWPCDIERAVQLALPVIIVQLSPLSINSILRWLAEKGYDFRIDVTNRLLHGLLLIHRGAGIVFINGTDSIRERRFTLAHEVSHFLLNYFLPREKVVEKLGESIVEVLDGIREPTIEERISGILQGVSPQPKPHFLEKRGDGGFDNYHNWSAENHADSLAVEILAPHKIVCQELLTTYPRSNYKGYKEKAESLLYEKYQLPRGIAQLYSGKLSYYITGGTSIVEKLGLK